VRGCDRYIDISEVMHVDEGGAVYSLYVMGRQHASTICCGGERKATGRQWVGLEMAGRARWDQKILPTVDCRELYCLDILSVRVVQ
jgi:hypothetical protein